jgi:hypothetical protein
VKAGGKQSSAFTLVSFLAYSSNLKMEAICSSESSVETQRTTRRHIPEDDDTLQFLYFCVRIRCRGYVFTEPLPSNGRFFSL